MKKYKFITVLSLFLLVPASIIWAQSIITEKGLTTVQFDLPQGIIKVMLAGDIRQGDIISGTIAIEPAGNTEKQKARSLEELLKSKLKAGDPNDPAQVSEGLLKRYQSSPGHITISTEVKSLPFAVTLTDAGNMNISIPVKTDQPYSDDLLTVAGCAIPMQVLAGSPLRVTGPFDGDMSNTKCTVNGSDLPVIAESPRGCFVTIPSTAAGENTIKASENGKALCERKISAVDMNVRSGKLSLKKGEQTYVEVQVTGLNTLTDTATLTIVNLSEAVVQMQPANKVIIALIPDSISDGNFTKRFTIQSIKTGNFSVNVNLDLPGAVYDIKNIETGLYQHPGSYGWREGDPCENAGPITWRWHRTLPCAVELKITPYGTTPDEKDAIDFIINKLKELSKKGGDMGSKMGKCLSFKDKAFSAFARCYRDWDDWDVTYICVDGKWVQQSMVYVTSGRDNLSGWIPLRNAGGNNEWFKSDPFAWMVEAIEKAVTCCD